MMQDFINKQFFNLFIFTFLFGLVLYGVIGFESIDEICAFILLIFFIFAIFKTPEWAVDKSFLAVAAVFLFYAIYSFYIHSNSTRGILSDIIIQFKPYLAFFAVYYLNPQFTPKQKDLLKKIVLILAVPLFLIGCASLINNKIFRMTLGFESYFAAIITASALLYYYGSDGRKMDKIVMLILLSIGLFSGRSKFYGFFIIAVGLVLFFRSISQLKINLKTILIVGVCALTVFYATRQKFIMYFGTGQNIESIPKEYMARSALYITSMEVFQDYFPFGSGFASFASYSSGVYYSPIYAKYGIETIPGINKNNYSYIADTYYPCLAQFGVVGVVLYFLFFIYLTRKAYRLYLSTGEEKHFIIPFLIIGYLLIENVADATFTGHRGFFIMMLLGLVLSDGRKDETPKSLALEEKNP